MRAWVSGGTGFLGGRLARLLRNEGHEVVALARPTSDTATLRAIGAEIRSGDVTDRASVEASMAGCDAGFHLAAWYEVGAADRQAVFRTNVGGTRTVLAAARATGLPRLVYCSTLGALGWHQPGELPDESREGRPLPESPYVDSKYRAHRVVREAVGSGVPVVTLMPGGVYGRGDRSAVGRMLEYVVRGWMVARVFEDAEFTFVHVDDVARSFQLAWEKGRVGEEYAIGGEAIAVGPLLDLAARLAGRRPPRVRIPTGVMRALVPVSGPFVRALGFPRKTLPEAIAVLDGKSWAYSWDKAARELGYEPRPLERGLSETIAALRRKRARWRPGGVRPGAGPSCPRPCP